MYILSSDSFVYLLFSFSRSAVAIFISAREHISIQFWNGIYNFIYFAYVTSCLLFEIYRKKYFLCVVKRKETKSLKFSIESYSLSFRYPR